MQKPELLPIPCCLAELLDGEDRSGSHAEGQSQEEEGECGGGGPTRRVCLFHGFGVNFVIASFRILLLQPVVDRIQVIPLILRHRLNRLSRIGVMKHQKPLYRLVWYHKDIPRPVACVVVLQQVLRVDPAKGQTGVT